MPAASEYSMKVRGLKQLLNTFNRVDKGVRKGITDRLRVLARDVAVKAREIAIGEGFGKPGRSGRGTGELVRDIRYRVTSQYALIREVAVRDGKFPYPAVYEYGHSKWGHRPFLHPALEAEHAHVEASIEAMLDGVLAANAE